MLNLYYMVGIIQLLCRVRYCCRWLVRTARQVYAYVQNATTIDVIRPSLNLEEQVAAERQATHSRRMPLVTLL